MISRWQWLLRRLTRKLWFRAGLLSLLGVVTALVAIVVAPVIPAELSAQIGADAVDNILNILASSMLVVTSFSLTTMVSAYSAATSNATPRATKLLIEDPTSQNALSTFIGSFLYGLVGIIALSTDVYGDRGRVVLFVVTVAVILTIVVTLVRWIDHLSRLGRVGETTNRVEKAAAKAIASRVENPYLGGRALHDPEREIPPVARPLYCSQVGYVQHIDVNELSDCADKHEGEIYLTAVPGTFVDPSRPLAWLLRIDDEDDDAVVRAAFTIDDERSFEQDPRFGLSVLTEIASRALSPAMNDAGTAIDVIGRAVRVLSLWPADDNAFVSDVPCPRVRVPPVRLGEMFDDVFGPIARDGAALVEVQIRLQKALRTLATIGDSHFAKHAARHARYALLRAEAALALEEEKEKVREIAAATVRCTQGPRE